MVLIELLVVETGGKNIFYLLRLPKPEANQPNEGAIARVLPGFVVTGIGSLLGQNP